ncbi:pilus assembly protein, partial [Salmonella enterica subsp. enterica serovar Rubislaw]|uniref:type IV secretion system protein n=1 Tax=Salmonella enterica TaxID=28901 RepID=UPI000D571024
MDYQTDFFRTAHKLIEAVVDNATKGQLAQFTSFAVELAQYGVTIYIIIYAMQTMAGRQKTPVPDFLWNMGKMAVIFMFVSNMDGWTDSAIKGIDELKVTLSGGADPWLWLDQLWVKGSQISRKILSLDTKTVPMAGILGSWATNIGTILALMSASVVFLVSELTIKLLTVTAPIFIMCLMFGFLRQMFNNWLQLIFSSILTLMFATLALRAGTSYLNHILSVIVKEAEKSNLVDMGFMALAAGIFTAVIAWLARHYASQLAGVGVEGAMQCAAVMGVG